MNDEAPRGHARAAPRDRRGRGMRGPAFGPGAPGRAGAGPPHRARAVRPGRRRRDERRGVALDRGARRRSSSRSRTSRCCRAPGSRRGCRWPRWCRPRRRRHRGWCCSAGRSSTARRRRADLEALVLTVVVEQLADYLGVPAEDVHPDYEGGPDVALDRRQRRRVRRPLLQLAALPLRQTAPDAEALVVLPVRTPGTPGARRRSGRPSWPPGWSHPSPGRTPPGRSERTVRAPAIQRLPPHPRADTVRARCSPLSTLRS